MGEDSLQFGLPESYFQEVCRICLLKSEVLIPIEEVIFTHCLTPNGEIENISLCKVLSDYCKVQVFPTDGKPQHICKVCVNMSSKAFNFFQLCFASNHFLDTVYPHLKNLSPAIEIPGEVQMKVEVIETCEQPENASSGIIKDHSSGTADKNANESIMVEDGNHGAVMEETPKKNVFQFLLDLNVGLIKKKVSKKEPKKIQEGEENHDDIEENYIFDCKQCSTTIHGIEKIIEHDMEFHRVERGIKCSICRKIFLGTRSYKYHMRLHSEKVLVCDNCRQYFPNKEDYDAHNDLIDHENGMCKLCNKKFKSTKRKDVFGVLRYHIEVNHFAQEAVTCDICGKVFRYINNLERHIRTVHNQVKITCPHCSKGVQTSWQLKLHMERHHPEVTATDLVAKYPQWFSKNTDDTTKINCPSCRQEFSSTHLFYEHCNRKYEHFNTYACQVCPEEFSTFQDLLTHQSEHTQYTCKSCDSAFVFSSDLVYHKKQCYQRGIDKPRKMMHRAHIDKRLGNVRNHLGRTSIKCQFCPIVVRSNYRLYRHSVIHPEFVNYTCETCGNTYDNLADLDRHNREDHESLCCKDCDMYFTSKTRLLVHRSHAHKPWTEKKKTQCDVCGVLLTGPRDKRDAHMNMHLGIKPFVCEICNKGFRQPAHLRIHKYQHDTGKDKPFKCQLCPKSFAYPSTLRCHFRTHTGEKPFKCLYCERTFAAPIARHKHIKKFHPERNQEYEQLRAEGVLRQEVKNLEGELGDVFHQMAKADDEEGRSADDEEGRSADDEVTEYTPADYEIISAKEDAEEANEDVKAESMESAEETNEDEVVFYYNSDLSEQKEEQDDVDGYYD